MISFGLASDRIMKYMTAEGKVTKPEYRLITMIPGVILLPIGLLWYGWTADKGVFWLGMYLSLFLDPARILDCYFANLFFFLAND
jgi:hypothetical protein